MGTISSKAQTDSDSSDEALNSATEISTDSEFDQDPVNHDPPKIFIDDSHLRKHRVQMKANHNERHAAAKQHQDVHLKFKPLVEVDPTIVKREPLKNPLPGNFLLSKTASTEGIASKKSLELKKRYLLGEAGNANSVMKSDSASALDTKLKSFHSNISECQKLLNPAAEISPSMQTFLQRIDRNNELNRSQHSITLSKINKDKFNNNQEEKENRSIDSNKKLEYSETVNTALIENKIREMSPEVPKEPEIIEIVDLVTPEKKQPIIDLSQVEIPKSTIDENMQFIENMEKSTSAHEVNMKIKTKLDSMFIDLTIDSPPKDKQSLEANNNAKPVPDILSSLTAKTPKDEENLERPRSPAHETTIEVPQIWVKAPKDVDTDSLSNGSSTSSLEDIPHFILDSATSPETLNDNFQAQPPRLEVRDSAGELMQIDSLMIIDGQYVGDPDDLHLFKDKLPEKAAEPVIEPEVPPASLSRPTFKFDTRNENKLESLINLPLIVAKEEVLAPKPLQLRFSDKRSPVTTPDGDKTPLAGAPIVHSDSENDMTGQGLTETELSDWTADDALSENFVDFALNSGKGTIKKKKIRSRKNGHNGVNHPKSSPVKAKLANPEVECGILKNLACGEIDFMDTGSEDSCVETLSTTNRAMLKNRGYVKFVDHQHSLNQHTPYNAYAAQSKTKERSPPIIEAINMEVVNVDFIEQGACILNNDLRTPVNEDPPDSLNVLSDEIEEDSLVVIEDKNQLESLQTTTTTTETTEELTIVTSPESFPRNVATPVNTTTPSSTVITSDSTPDRDQEPLRFDRSAERASSGSRVSREQIEEMGGYEEYVKSLQMKIAQISSGRESLEKKTRRKLSKSDLLGDDSKASDANKSIFSPATLVEPPQTLSMKLEELTKERTKQKDIIHDLVMDKLQAKKQMNAEKRMNRSRNRNLFMGTGAGSFPLSPIKTPDSTPEPSKHVITYRESVNNLKEFDDKTLNGSAEVPKPFAEPQSVSKLSKTQSFNYYTKHVPLKNDDADFKTPVPPPRSRINSSSDLTHTAEKMREDARARARLKSNEDLGLSPEEKILMLRRRYNLMQHSDMQPSSALFSDGRNQSDDVKFREKKLSSSKSFNDISRMQRYSKDISDGLRNHSNDFMSDPNLADAIKAEQQSPKSATTSPKVTKSQRRDSERRKSLIQTVSDFFHKKKDTTSSNKDLTSSSPTSASKDRLSETSSTTSMFSRFRLSPKSKDTSKDKAKEKDATPPYTGERSKSVASLKYPQKVSLIVEKEQAPPIPPLPLNYQRSDDEGSFQTNESRNELKKLRAMSKASKQAELKRLRIAQEIKREQDEIDLKIKDLETRGVELEKMLRGEGQNIELLNESSLSSIGSSDEDLLKELLDIWRNITQYKKRDEELIIRQQELQLEHRHAQLKEELSVRLSCSKLDKSAQDVAAEGAILSEMLEIVAKRAALRPSDASTSLSSDQVSLPVLPPQTTINPLHQQFHAHSSQRYQSPMVPNNRNIHTFSSQSHNQEHEVSDDDDFLFDGTENFYLRTNLSLLHDCMALLEQFESQYTVLTPRKLINAQMIWVIVEFLVLYFGVLYYTFTRV